VKPVVDPRHGDVETDVSSTKRRSLLSLAGGLLVEISLPKLIMAWTLLLLVPGLLLGLGPIVVSDWVRTLSGSIATFVVGIWSLLVLAAVLALGYFGWRTLFRLVENSFWALNSVVLEVFVERGHSHGPDPFGDQITNRIIHHCRSYCRAHAKAVGQIGRHVKFSAADVDIAVARFAKRHNPGIKPMNQRAQ